ncbi:hypothetical protein HPP92_015318 [Vanilla planifolia]|uniref:Uncharacterized protein n=1 Tax=Vanilla planifolia TaxID=51239 RepID=A0A835QXJ1_VANPL|nr:hypothetical protein HPP92_015318 [Vanilla planifolia]
MGRAPCCDKANVKKGPWSPEEDAMLKAYIEEHGTVGNWIALPRNIGLRRSSLVDKKEAPIVEQDLDSSQTLTRSTVERLQLHLQLQGHLSNYHDVVDILPKASEMRDPHEVICEDNIRFPKSSPSSSFLIEKELYELLYGEGMGLWKENVFNVKTSSTSSDSYSNIWSDSRTWDWH